MNRSWNVTKLRYTVGSTNNIKYTIKHGSCAFFYIFGTIYESNFESFKIQNADFFNKFGEFSKRKAPENSGNYIKYIEVLENFRKLENSPKFIVQFTKFLEFPGK